MTHLKHLPATTLPVLLVVPGLGCAVAGLYLLGGLAVTLLVGGCVAVAAGLLVDV